MAKPQSDRSLAVADIGNPPEWSQPARLLAVPLGDVMDSLDSSARIAFPGRYVSETDAALHTLLPV